MPQTTLTIENSIRPIRIVYIFILVAMAMQVTLAEKLSHQEPRDVHVIYPAFLVVGLVIIGIAVFFRVKWLRPAGETLQTKSDDQAALARWRSGNILTFVLMDSVLLYGVAVRFMGGTFTQSLPFYAVGIALMLAWWPRRP
jgi:hypothetical protein